MVESDKGMTSSAGRALTPMLVAINMLVSFRITSSMDKVLFILQTVQSSIKVFGLTINLFDLLQFSKQAYPAFRDQTHPTQK